MKRILGVLIATTGLAGLASAADIMSEPIPQMTAPVAPVVTWSGFYVGAHVGYGWGEIDIRNNNNNSSNNPPVRGSEIPGTDADEQDLLYIIENCRPEAGTFSSDCEDLGLEYNEEDNRYETGAGPWLDVDGDVEGAFGGGQLGYDIQLNRFLLGIVADASVSGLNGTATFYQDDDDASDRSEDIGDGVLNYEPATQSNFRVEYDWMATIRGRAGWLPADNWLVYAHGGLAAASVSVFGVGTIGPYTDSNTSEVAIGWIAGVGTEVRLSPHHSFFAEYSFADFGEIDLEHKEAAGRADVEADTGDTHLFKVGFNWRPEWMFGP